MAEAFGASANTWVAIAAIAAGAQTAIVAVAAWAAFRQVREARQSREDQARPFVVMDFDGSEFDFIYVVVKNIGATIARKVGITVSPPLASSFDRRVGGGGEVLPMAKARLLTEEIPSLAPGKEIRFLFDTRRTRESLGLEDIYRATITYEGERGRAYTDEMILDLSLYRHPVYVQRASFHQLYGQIEDIARTLRRWSSGKPDEQPDGSEEGP